MKYVASFALFLAVLLTACGGSNDEAEPATLTAPTNVAPAPATQDADPNNGNTALYEVDPADPYLISNGTFLGFGIGEPLAANIDLLRKGVLRTGEGTFQVYYIDDADGEELGYVMDTPDKAGRIDRIAVKSPKVVTERGVRIGLSVDELEQRLGPLEWHGSEVEGRAGAEKDGLYYRIDQPVFQYEVSREEIKDGAKVVEISLR